MMFTFLACFISLIGYMGATIYVAAIPTLDQVFHVSHALIKSTITVFYLGLIMGIIVCGPIARWYGCRPTLMFFLSLIIISNLVCGFSPSIEWFLGGRLLEGIGNAGGPILIMATIADQYKGSAYHRLMSYVLLMISLGPMISPILGSCILHFFEWRFVFYLFAFSGFVALMLVFYSQNVFSTEQSKRGSFQEYLTLIKHPTFRYYCIMIGTLYGSFYAVFIICSYIFHFHYDWQAIDFASMGLILPFANTLGIFLNKKLIEKINSQAVVFIGLSILGISLLCLFLIGLVSSGIGFLMIVALFIIGQSLAASCLTEEAIKLIPKLTNMSSTLIRLSRDGVIMLALLLISFFPENLNVINWTIFGTLLICAAGYWKIFYKF